MQQPPTASNMGMGNDFVLFDDAPRGGAVSGSGMPQATPGAEWSSAWGSGSSSVEVPSLRAFTGVGGAGAGVMPMPAGRPGLESNASFTQYRAPSTSAMPPDSPFSSPASRPDDDFGAGATINPKSGAPNRKRQRPAGYGHGGGSGSNSSSTGWGHTRMLSQGSLGSQGSAADWISDHSSTSPQAQANGYAAAQQMGARMAAHASQQQQHQHQQQHHVAKGTDWLSDTSVSPQNPPSSSFGPAIQSLNLSDAGPSLFPANGVAASEAEAAQARALFALSLSNTNANVAAPSSLTSTSMPYQPPHDWVSSVPVAHSDRVRQQVQADLAGVDPRALKGPLRDIQQGGQGTAPVRQGRVPVRPVAPRRRSGSLDSAMPPAVPDTSWMQWTGPTAVQQAGAPAMEVTHSWDGTPAQFSTQLSNYLDAFAGGQPMPQQQQHHQQRRSSLQVGHADGRPRMSRDRSGLTVSPHETLLDWDASNGRAFSLFPGLSDSLVGRVRATGAPKRMPLDRNETARPSPQQQAAMAQQHRNAGTAQQQQQHAHTSSEAASQGSAGSLFSPTNAAPFGTPSSDDEDEALYRPPGTAGTAGSGSAGGFAAQAPAAAAASSLAGAGMINGAAQARGNAGQQVNADFPFPPQQQKPQHAQGLSGMRTSAGGGSGAGPRFGDVSSSSSEDEGESSRGRTTAPTAPTQRVQRMGGYGYMAGSAESGLSVAAPGYLNVPGDSTSAESAEARRRSDSQSNDDDGGASPSIRSSAQAIPQPQRAVPEPGTGNTPRQRSVSRPRGSGGAQASGTDEGEWEEDEDADGSDEGSDYEAGAVSSTRTAAASSTRKRGRRPRGTSSKESSGTTSNAPARLAAGLPKATNAPSSSGMHSAANAAGITTCDYVSRATNEYCGTEFHRPYDLARHRETIHGKEEATLLRQGKITKEDCAVLYREVDPAKSLATVEWKCDGKNGCGSVFSR